MDHTALTLTSSIASGELVLPDIQRSFVWSEEQIYALFDSLLRGYPVGSLLFWRAIGSSDVDGGIVYHRFITDFRDGDPLPPQTELRPDERRTIVLDGQQRLQSLYLGLEGTYEGRELYLDLLSGSHVQDQHNGVAHYVRFMTHADATAAKTRNPGRLMVALKRVIRIPPEARSRFKATLLSEEFQLELYSDAGLLAQQKLDQVWHALYFPSVPAVTIDAHATRASECRSLEEVAEIFVRVNDGGTKLSKADLIFSLMKSRWTTASEEIQGLCDQVNVLGEFEVTKDFVIRCLMVLCGRSARYSVSDVRRPGTMDEFRKNFSRASEAIRSTFDFLTKKRGAGIRSWRLLAGGQRADRGYNVLIPIALHLFLRKSQALQDSELRSFRRYLYHAVLSRYAVRYVEGRLDALAHLIHQSHASGDVDFPADALVDTIRRTEFYTDLHELLTRPQSLDPLLNILSGGGVDFRSANSRNSPQRDHIFPKSKLAQHGYSSEEINHVANMQLLDGLANLLKSAKDPEEVFAGYDPQVLASDDYLIPKHLLAYDSYRDFLRERLQMINGVVERYLMDTQGSGPGSVTNDIPTAWGEAKSV